MKLTRQVIESESVGKANNLPDAAAEYFAGRESGSTAGKTITLRLAFQRDVRRSCEPKTGDQTVERQGRTVARAENGCQAVDMFRGERFDVILMDVQMPEMDGFDATAAILVSEARMGLS